MNWSIIEGKWGQMKGAIKAKWAKITDDDLQNISAKRDRLVGIITERYGVLKDEADKQVDEWLGALDRRTQPAPK